MYRKSETDLEIERSNNFAIGQKMAQRGEPLKLVGVFKNTLTSTQRGWVDAANLIIARHNKPQLSPEQNKDLSEFCELTTTLSLKILKHGKPTISEQKMADRALSLAKKLNPLEKQF